VNRPKLDFQAIKDKVSFVQAAQMLHIDLKRDGAGFRCGCSTGTGGDRIIKLTPGKGWYCHACREGGHDVIAFVAHINHTGNYEAADTIAKHFGIGTASNKAPSPAETRKPAQDSARDGLQPLEYLTTDHEVIELLGLSAAACEALGAGYAPKGTMSGRILIPLRLPDGTLAGYFGIACKPDMTPLLKFPANLEAMCGIKPTVEEPTEPENVVSMDAMKKLLRVS
jgi:hypothetical protein